jgi:GNAT superfamily N-acetyltransferase
MRQRNSCYNDRRMQSKSPAADSNDSKHIRHAVMNIREATAADLATIAMLVSESNKDVAERFGLTADNCPRHPSFCTAGWVQSDLERGERYFILEVGAVPLACVAYENPSAGLAYLNRLSVLPAHRRHGIGARLVRHIIQLARAASIQTISIGVIGEHDDLQRWYRYLGFVDGETRRFPHLPFSVKYMSYAA